MEWFDVDNQLPDTEREVRVWVDYNDGLRATGRYSGGNWFIFPNYQAPVTHWHEHKPPPNTRMHMDTKAVEESEMKDGIKRKTIDEITGSL
jgi:hypothetical protein